MNRLIPIGAMLLAATLSSQTGTRKRPGPQPDGSVLLANNWTLRPAGRQVPLRAFPMSSALSRDGKYLVVLHAGIEPPSLTVLDTATMAEVSRTPVEDTWLGLAFSPDGKLLYVSGASKACVYEFSFNAGKLALTRTFPVKGANTQPPRDGFVGDVVLSPNGRLLYAAGLFDNSIFVINPQSGRVIDTFATGRRPYRILFHPDGKSYFVSSWVEGSVYHHNADSGERLSVTRIAQHPTDLLWLTNKTQEAGSEGAGRLFVAAAHTNNIFAVAVSGTREMRLSETIYVGLQPRQPIGMTPSALAASPDQAKLYVACSDANAVAAIDISEQRSSLIGFVASGWYPTDLQLLPDNRLIVLNGLSDSASVIDGLDDTGILDATRAVVANSPYRDELVQQRLAIPAGSPIPSRPGDPTPIQNVILIAGAGTTYDALLGDLARGDSQKQFLQNGASTTPNHHKLAAEFTLLDNFYLSGASAIEATSWNLSAIVPDFVQKLWRGNFAKRRLTDDFGSGEAAARPPAGYLWNNAAAAGLSFRNYGWWVKNRTGSEGQAEITGVIDPVLAKFTNMQFRGPDPAYPDTRRTAALLSDLASFEASGQFPKLLFVNLGGESDVRDHDKAIGQIISAVSKSKFWESTAVFILPSGTGGAKDHVHPNRAAAFVISPYTRGAKIDSTFYNTASVLRTVELITGLRPLTQFDAAAMPMWAAFNEKPDLRPYEVQ